MLAFVDNSKMRQQKADLTDMQKEFKISKVYNCQAQLTDRSAQLCNQLQNEINCDEASIFQNKKYREILKFAIEQQEEIFENLKDQYDIESLVQSLQELSIKRQALLGGGDVGS